MKEEDNYANNKFKRGARTELGTHVVKKLNVYQTPNKLLHKEQESRLNLA